MPRRRFDRPAERERLSPSLAPSMSSDSRSDARTITSMDESEYTSPTTTSIGGSEEEERPLAETHLVIAVDYGTTYTGMEISP